MVLVENNPKLAEAFRDENLNDFFKEILEDLSNPYVLKEFLKEGWEKYYENQIEQLKKCYVAIKSRRDNPKQFVEVVRSFDGVHFKLGDLVIDKVAPDQRALPIGLMYEDDRGLHIRLNVDDNGTITWRDLGRIEHAVIISHPAI